MKEQVESLVETGTGGERRDGRGTVPPTISTTIRSRGVPPGAVYIVEAADLGLVKIGMTVDVPHRLRTLQCMCPAKLTVLAAFHSKDPPGDERELHARFAGDRRHGEWFTATDEITDWAWHDSRTGVAHRKRAQEAIDAAWGRRLPAGPDNAKRKDG